MTDAAMIARLEALAVYTNDLTGDPIPGRCWQDCAADLTALLTERERLVALLGDTEGALQPFAEAGSYFDNYGYNKGTGGSPDETVIIEWPDLKVTIGHFRRAATVLQRIKESK